MCVHACGYVYPSVIWKNVLYKIFDIQKWPLINNEL
jgi:hypothetical protein